MQEAACKGENARHFTEYQHYPKAALICQQCPVVGACGDYARSVSNEHRQGPLYGTYGGEFYIREWERPLA